ncbi:MAG: ABC transporter permease [Thaumarchaeota archaeon]|nr:ABC transporter permease [Nitrososphaerota archaeon]
MNNMARLVYRNLRANLDKASLFFELIFPLFFIFVQGAAVSGIVPPFEIGNGKVVSYALFLAGGAVTLTVINGGTNAGTQLWFDRRHGMFEQILMGPFTRAQYIFSIIITTLIIGMAGSSLVFLFALPVLSGISITAQAALLTGLALFLGTVFFGAFAISLSVALKSSESFQIISAVTFFIFLFTSSVFFPIDRAPNYIQAVSLLNPLTYTTDIFRAGLFDAPTPLLPLEMTVLAVEAAVMFTIAVFAFRRIKV